MTAVHQLSTKDYAAKQRKEIIAKYDRGPSKNKSDNWENPQFSVFATTDYYGFIHDEGLTQEFLEKELKIKKFDCKRETKWRKLLTKKTVSKTSRLGKVVGSESMFSNILSRMNGDSAFREEITKRIYKGIPQQFKSGIWQVFLDVANMKNSKPKVYQNMLKKALEKSPDVHQIDLDVNRTFRNTTYFRERYNDRQKALLHVLAAYSMYNTEIGYCQGMSEVAGLLLMYLVDEEDVFWGLSQLMTSSRYCMHGIFVVGFPRLLTFFAHLNNIIHKLLPKIGKHFEKLEVMVSSYALKWFMQCYLDRVPLTLFLRLWDIYLLEGEKLLIAMAYNILKMHKKRIIKMDHGSILQFFQNELRRNFLYEDDLVIESLKNCIEELKKHKLSVPAPPQNNELPCRPFGTDIDFHTPSPKAVLERQLAQSNPAESIRRSLRKSRNNESTNQNSSRIANRQNIEDKEIPTKENMNDVKSKRTDGPNKANDEKPISSHIVYRIKNNSSTKIKQSKSLHLGEEKALGNDSETQGTRKKTVSILLPESRSLVKSVPDLSNQNNDNNNNNKNDKNNNKNKISHDIAVSNHITSIGHNSTPALTNGNPSATTTNHVSLSSSASIPRHQNSIVKSRTTSALSTMQQQQQQQQSTLPRVINRRPLSSSPETIL